MPTRLNDFMQMRQARLRAAEMPASVPDECSATIADILPQLDKVTYMFLHPSDTGGMS